VSIFRKIRLKISALKLAFLKKRQKNKTQKFLRHDQTLVQKLTNKKKLPTGRQLHYVGKFLSGKERLTIRIASGILLVAVASLLINLYWTNSELKPDYGGVYTEGLVGSPHYINPLFAQSNDVDLDISALIFSGLFKFTNQGLTKDLVKDYKLSNDQLTYTLKLKKNVYWHDGEKLDADDVIFTFNRILNKKTKSPIYFNFQGIKIQKKDQYTIAFVLSEPFAPFLESLTVGILPQHIWQNIRPENMLLAEYNLKPVGSGPYEFKSLAKTKNGEIKNFKLQANEDYYNNQAYVEEIVFKFYPNFDLAVEALNNKKVDGISYLPKEIRARIINNRNINFHLLNLPQYTAVFFNYANNAILKDDSVRKILSHATNKEKIVNNILNAEAQIINSCILPETLGYNPDIIKYPFNIDHAKTELEKAGWELQDYQTTEQSTENKETEDKEENEQEQATKKTESTVSQEEQYAYQVRKKNKRYLEFSLTTVNQSENVEIAKELQREWQQIGVKLNLNIVNENQMPEIIKNRDYEALLYGQILGYDPDPFPFWHSSQRSYPGLSLTSLNNSEIDQLLETARGTMDSKKRATKYKEFQAELAKIVPAIFLFNPTYTYPQNKKIKGFSTEKIIEPANRFNNVTDWYIKTDRKWTK